MVGGVAGVARESLGVDREIDVLAVCGVLSGSGQGYVRHTLCRIVFDIAEILFPEIEARDTIVLLTSVQLFHHTELDSPPTTTPAPPTAPAPSTSPESRPIPNYQPSILYCPIPHSPHRLTQYARLWRLLSKLIHSPRRQPPPRKPYSYKTHSHTKTGTPYKDPPYNA